MSLVADINAAVDARRQETIDLLARAVAIPSINPAYQSSAEPWGTGEGAFQAFLAGVLRDDGLRVELWEPDLRLVEKLNEPVHHAPTYAGRPNLLCWLGEGRGGRTLILNSHADVVGIWDRPQWTGDPLVSRIVDGRLIGRGASDAKGSLIAMAAAMRLLKEMGMPLRGQVLLESVADEEAGGYGALACCLRGLTADAAIVGEPSDLEICPGCRGFWVFSLTVDGKAAHPGRGWEGVNAILKTQPFLQAMLDLPARLDRERPHPLWASLPAQHVWNIVYLNGGTPIGSAVPDRCEMRVSGGIIGDETLEDLRGWVEAAVGEITQKDPWLRDHPPRLDWSDRWTHAAATPPEHPLVRGLAEAFQEVAGRTPTVRAMSAATDMRHLVRAGRIPTLNFGPGPMGAGHTADEWLPLEELITAVKILAVFIARWCA